jgi:hypothetical protein
MSEGSAEETEIVIPAIRRSIPEDCRKAEAAASGVHVNLKNVQRAVPDVLLALKKVLPHLGDVLLALMHGSRSPEQSSASPELKFCSTRTNFCST